jgi:hypothetical protein
MTLASTGVPVRGTQTSVGQMGWVFKHPSLTTLEVAWRWAFGIPLLLVCHRQWLQILALHPLEASGFNSIDEQNPWVASVQLANVWSYYQPHVFAVMVWLVPLAAVAWAVISGVGRNIVLRRIDRGLPFRPVSMIALQAAFLVFLAATFWAWFTCMRWVAATHISTGAEPDLVGYFVWVIALSLAFFTFFALVSWVLSIAPLLLLLEKRSVPGSLAESLKLGKEFASKLAEINLMMGIVKLALIVLAMVFSAAPLPFSDELGPGALQMVTAGAMLFYLVANDYFQVVRLKGFMEFWRTYRG